MKRFIAILAAVLLLTGCAPQIAVPTESKDTTAEPATVATDLTELFTDRDYKTDYEKTAVITLSDSGSTCDSNAVQIDGSTITVTDEGTYVLTGKLTDGQVIVRADKTDKTQLVLENVSIRNSATAPIYIEQADKVFVTLVGENALSADALDETIDAALFSKEDLTINGSGSLNVTSALHGIVSKDELTVTGGSFHITCASHGITGKDNLCIDGGSFAIAAGKDGLHSENKDDSTLGFVYIKSGDFRISAEGDGISAAAWMQLDGGTYDIETGGGSENAQQKTSSNWGGMGGGRGPGGFGGMGGGKRPGGAGGFASLPEQTADTTDTTDSTSIKGIKASGELVINGGSYQLNCADDAVHSNLNLTVTGGDFAIATGDDGFHADETLTLTDGTVSITESYEGLEGLHVKVQGGDIALVASDDGLNAAGGTDDSGMGGRDQFGGGRGFGGMGAGNGSILISGGMLAVTASGDGIDANGTLEITGGHTTVCGPTRGDTATLDYDKTATISGGTFIGTGGAGMAQTFSDATQGLISLSVGNQTAGTQIKVTDSQGKVLIDYAPALDFAVVILSSPDLAKGQTYTVQIGTQTQSVTA